MVVHYVNPRVCKTCSKEFKLFSDLKNHRQNATPKACGLCDKVFCIPTDYKNHMVVEHRGGQVEPEEDTEYKNILKQVIFPATGLENEEYEKIMVGNASTIKDSVKERTGIFTTINKELTPGFTFKDLRDIIVEAVGNHKLACKFNIGFGFILKHNISNEYRYYYVSTNHQLFERARTISTICDV